MKGETLMIRLQHIIQKVVEYFQLIVMDDYDTELLIYRVEIISPKTIYDENTLYLSDKVPVHPLPPANMVCHLMTAEPEPVPFFPIRITRQPPAE